MRVARTLLSRCTPPTQHQSLSTVVPISSLSKKFRSKFNIQYEPPRPAESLIQLGGPVFTSTPLEERTLEFELRQTELQETKLGSRGSRRLRAAGYLPCAILGGGPLEFNPKVSVTIPTKEIEKLVRKYGQRLENTIFKITISEYPGQQILVVPRQLDTHPVSDELLNLNFLRLTGKMANKKKNNHKLSLEIPLEYVDHDLSPAIKRGGYVNRTRWKLPCVVDPDTLIVQGAGGAAAEGSGATWVATEDHGYDSQSGLTTTDLQIKEDIPQLFEVSVAGFEVRDRIRVSNITVPVGIEADASRGATHDLIVANVRGKNVVSMADGGDGDGDEDGLTF